MRRRFSPAGLLIALGTFILGVAASDFLTFRNTDSDLEIAFVQTRSCVRLEDVRPSKDGPGSEVYRKRKERILVIDRRLDELSKRKPARRSDGSREWCANAIMAEFMNLIEERNLMVELTETVDGTKLVHREVCYEE